MQLRFTNGPKSGSVRKLQPPGVSIGREVDNDIQLLVAGVSRYHAKISFDGSLWKINDAGSTNGTRINGKPAEGVVTLVNGDTIALGDQTFVFEDENAAARPIPVPPPVVKAPTAPEPVLKDIPPRKTDSGIPPIITPAGTEKVPDAIPQQDAKSILAELRNKGSLFGGNEGAGDAENGEKRPESAGKAGKGGKSLLGVKLGNVIFFISMVTAALLVAVVFKAFQDSKNTPGNDPAPVEKDQNKRFMLNYEKTRSENDNIFRFSLTIENGNAEFVLDDIKYGRHFVKKIPGIKPDILKWFEEEIKDTEFMKLDRESEGVPDKVDERRRLTIALGDELNSVTVKNTYAKSSFEKIERAVEKFSEEYGIRTVSLGVEEMKIEAGKVFRRAETLFENYLADPANLRNAIIRYKLTMEYLDSFEPKPEEWVIARKRLEEAKTLFDQQLKDFSFNAQKFANLKQYDKAAAECQKVMDMVDPDSETYLKAKSLKIQNEKKLRKKK